MTGFRFGSVVGMDAVPGLRILVLGLASERDQRETVHANRVWQGLVLADEGKTAWPVGMVVTLAPDMAGVIVIEEG